MTDINRATWRGFTENPAAMMCLFEEAVPHLSAVRFTGIHVGETQFGVRLKMALEYPRGKTPLRWQAISANAVWIELQCFGVEELSVMMRPGDSTVSCDFSRDKAGNHVLRIVGPSIDLVVRCGFLGLSHVLPYTAEPSAILRGPRNPEPLTSIVPCG